MDGVDVTDSMPNIDSIREALAPKSSGTCEHPLHDVHVELFTTAVADCEFFSRLHPVLEALACEEAVKYSPKGWAYDLCAATKGVTAPPADLFVPRWHWCLACMLRPKLLHRFKEWRDVWAAYGYVNDDYAWLPIWCGMVPPRGQCPRNRGQASHERLVSFYDRCVVVGSENDELGVHAASKKVDAKAWIANGGSVACGLAIRYGVQLPLNGEKRPYKKHPYGNYKELHTDPTMKEAFQRGHKKMVDWGMVTGELSAPPFDIIPQFIVRQRKDDGSMKERGIQDATASGLNDIIMETACVLCGVDDIYKSFRSGDYVSGRDLSNAFWHWNYNCRFALLFGASTPDGRSTVLLRCLLMGVKNSPGVQQWFMEDLCSAMVKLNCRRPIPYIDDATSSQQPLPRALEEMALFDKLIGDVGLTNATEKKQGPSKDGVVSLGKVTDTRGEGRGYIGEARLQRYIDDPGCTVQGLLDVIDSGAAYIPLGARAVVASRIMYIAPQIWSGIAHVRPLYEGWVQFSSCKDIEATAYSEDDGSVTPSEGWTSQAPRWIADTLRVVGITEHNREDYAVDHPILRFWWDKAKVKEADCWNPRFPVPVTKRFHECLLWWKMNVRTRNGVPLGLGRPPGMRGRLTPDLIDVDHEFIDQHSRTRAGFHVITTDAATHGDTDDRPRAGFWYGTSERHEVLFPRGKYGIFGLEGAGMLAGLRTLGPKVPTNEVVIRNDNQAGVQAMNKGMSRDDDFQDIITDTYEESWLQRRAITFVWLCTNCNWLADGISRGTIKVTSCDFMFSADEFALMTKRIGHSPDIDGFANEEGDNSLCKRWLCPARSFFTADLRGLHVWINADFLLIVEAIEFWLKAKHAAPACTRATVLVPVYSKSRPWARLLEKHFTRIHEYPLGSYLFYSRPASRTATESDGLRMVGRGMGERRCIGPTRWPVQIWHCA